MCQIHFYKVLRRVFGCFVCALGESGDVGRETGTRDSENHRSKGPSEPRWNETKDQERFPKVLREGTMY